MTDAFATSFRTGLAGALGTDNAGEKVRLVGWVHRRRDLGGLVFLDLRDRAGIVQVSFDPANAPAEAIREARALGPEDVVQVSGTVRMRPEGKGNADLSTGAIEVLAESLTIVQA